MCIMSWWEKYKQVKKIARRYEGYKFAAASILKGMSMTELKSYILTAYDFSTNEDFDMGVLDAIDDAVKLGVYKEEDDHD